MVIPQRERERERALLYCFGRWAPLARALVSVQGFSCWLAGQECGMGLYELWWVCMYACVSGRVDHTASALPRGENNLSHWSTAINGFICYKICSCSAITLQLFECDAKVLWIKYLLTYITVWIYFFVFVCVFTQLNLFTLPDLNGKYYMHFVSGLAYRNYSFIRYTNKGREDTLFIYLYTCTLFD